MATEPVRQAVAYPLHQLSFALLLATVILAPLPYGSVEAHWIAIWCVFLAVACLTADLTFTRVSHARLVAPVLLVAALFGITVALQSAQSGLLTPHPIWAESGRVLGVASPKILPTVSVGAPWLSVGHAILLAGVFTLSFTLSTSTARADAIHKAIAFSGIIYAIYGVFGLIKNQDLSLTSTFINRNTAATYLGTCAILWLSLFVSSLDRDISTSKKPILRLSPSAPTITAAAALLVTLTAVPLTTSRAGTLLTVLALVVTGGLLVRRRLPRWSSPVLTASGLVCAVAIVVALLGERVGLRISHDGLIDENRMLAYRSGLAIVADNAWLGTGLGTFADVFPSYRKPEMASAFVWDRAHSSALELAVEMGLPLAAMVLILWAYLLLRLVQGCFSRHRGVRFPAVGLGVLLLGTLHSVVDFSLQIPGYSVVFAALTACGLAQVERAGPSSESRRSSVGPTTIAIRGMPR